MVTTRRFFYVIYKTPCAGGYGYAFRAFEVNNNIFECLHIFEKNETVLGVEIVEQESKTNFINLEGRIYNTGVPCSVLERERFNTAIEQWKTNNDVCLN